ncbi:MAG: cardiolipin synthase [Planctomycetota bacterium]|nr:cardiolipin synthase [Planctomycetota bacterium]
MKFPDWTIFYIASEWAIRLVMLVVVTRRRRPVAAMSWLVVIFFEPWIGLVLYTFLGRYRLPRKRVRQYAAKCHELEGRLARRSPHAEVALPEMGAAAQRSLALATTLGEMPVLGGNDFELIARADVAIDRLTEDIDAAVHHVHLLFYIFENDRAGGKVLDAMTRAVGRGVTCRLLVDAVGSRPLLRRHAREIRARGIELTTALEVGTLRRLMARIDLRNHRKLAVIDGRTAYTGSQNIIEATYGRKGMEWRDVMLRLTGPVVWELQEVFCSDWYFETEELLETRELFPDPAIRGAVPVQALPSGPNYPTGNYQRIVVDAIHGARRNVTITTPYFVPDEPLLQACETALHRGVEIDLILPRRGDHRIVHAVSMAYAGELLEMGARVHLFHDGLLHAKTMNVDDEIALIGSSNFDIRSFELNFEINLLLYGPGAVGVLRRQQELYKQSSRLLTLEAFRGRPAVRRLASNVAKLFSPLL